LRPGRGPAPIEPFASSVVRSTSDRQRMTDDDVIALPMLINSDDSQYELPVTAENCLHDSQVEIAVLKPEVRNPNVDFPGPVDDLPVGVIAVTKPKYFYLIDSWARYQFVVAVTSGIISLAILGLSLFRAGHGVQAVRLSATAQIAGGIALVAFSLLLVTATALNLLLIDLAKSARRLTNSHDR
jgi:hypothetical protein